MLVLVVPLRCRKLSILRQWKSKLCPRFLLFQIRQIIEQVIESEMQEQQLMSGQVVWATLQAYPPWPARVINAVECSNHTIYRVEFFGAPPACTSFPSSCYMVSSQLTEFSVGLHCFQSKFEKEFKLQSSINLAKESYRKQQLLQIQVPAEHSLTGCSESGKQVMVRPEHTIGTPDRLNTNKSTQYQQLIGRDVSTGNVLQILSSPLFQQFKNSKGYNKRKQICTLKLSLKEKLLQKYKFMEPRDRSSPLKPDKHLKKCPRRPSKKIKNARKTDLCAMLARKVNKAVQRYCPGPEGRKLASKIHSQMQEIHELNNLKYRTIFKSVVCWLRMTELSEAQSDGTVLLRMGESIAKTMSQTAQELT